jgi:hypothetical protein
MTSPGGPVEPPYLGPPPTGRYRPPPLPMPLVPPYAGPYPQYPAYPPTGGAAGDRPATAMAAAVVAWVLAGLLFIAAGLLFFGATFLHDIEAANGYSGDEVSELLVDGVLDIVAAGMLVAGGVALAARNRHGRPLLVGGSALVVVLALYWLIRWAGRLAGVTTGYAVMFGAGALLVAAFTATGRVSSWLAAGP